MALSNGNKILVQELDTKSPEGKLCEAHRDYLDIQYIVYLHSKGFLRY